MRKQEAMSEIVCVQKHLISELQVKGYALVKSPRNVLHEIQWLVTDLLEDSTSWS
jgi:hypothetical protein